MKQVIAIVGATCSGKTTLARLLVQRGCAEVISTTTREARPGELHGRDYWFVEQEAFLAMQYNGALIEVAYFGGHFYGISQEALRAAFTRSDTIVAVVTPKGCLALQRWSAKRDVAFRSVFLTAKASVLRERLVRERPDGQARLRGLLEQVRHWRKRAAYDLVLPGQRAASAVELVLGEVPA